MPHYSKASQKKVGKVMREYKQWTLRSGSGKKVSSRKQAVAIGLSEARKAGAKVPRSPSRDRARTTSKRTASRTQSKKR